MSKVVELKAYREQRSRTLQRVREIASVALWVDPSRIQILMRHDLPPVALLDGRPFTKEESEVISRYLDTKKVNQPVGRTRRSAPPKKSTDPG